MDPISLMLIVNVLSAGSLALSKQLGGKAVEHAYRKLRGLLVIRVKSGEPIEALERAPESPIQKKALAKALAKVSIDSGLVASARNLEKALSNAETYSKGKSARDDSAAARHKREGELHRSAAADEHDERRSSTAAGRHRAAQHPRIAAKHHDSGGGLRVSNGRLIGL